MDVYKSEEEQVETIKKWWSENARALLIGVSIALVSVFSWEGWQEHQLVHGQEASNLFQQLSLATESEVINTLSDELISAYSDTPYAALAGLQKAKDQLLQKDNEAALLTLEAVVQNTANSSVKHIAQLRILRIRLATGDEKALIADIDALDKGEFLAQYENLKGDAYYSLADFDQARVAYLSALTAAVAEKQFIQQKLDDLGPAKIKNIAQETAE